MMFFFGSSCNIQYFELKHLTFVANDNNVTIVSLN